MTSQKKTNKKNNKTVHADPSLLFILHLARTVGKQERNKLYAKSSSQLCRNFAYSELGFYTKVSARVWVDFRDKPGVYVIPRQNNVDVSGQTSVENSIKKTGILSNTQHKRF